MRFTKALPLLFLAGVAVAQSVPVATTPPVVPSVSEPAKAPQPAVVTPPVVMIPPVVLPKIPDPRPISTTTPNVLRYLVNPNLLKFASAQVAGFNDKDADMIFIGDSITEAWLGPGKEVWDANFAPRNALDFGISGDETEHVLWRLSNYPLQKLHPKVGVILIGTNNTHNTPAEIAEGVKAVIGKTQSLFPGIKIILVSIMPNRRANSLMMAADEILKTFDDNRTVFYLDMVPLMTPVGDNWKGLSTDHLHPNAAGYQLWTDAMLPLLNRLLPVHP